MKKLLTLTALLLGSAAAVALRGEKRTIGMPQWIADYSSLNFHGAGAPMNWAAWTDAKYGTAGRRLIPSGTAVSLVSGKIVPADGSLDTLLLFSDAREDAPTDSPSGYGLVTAGNVYEAQLPDSTGAPAVLATAVRTKAARFYLQQ
ncbi:hypothetical protein K7W42_17975 [Deinococcus sp. HMF7604]|uniref:hypothetical protein n=1 Tax=Deinococcus betulae TaxID=2873312 RepID=UPI001CCBBF27|nr:hypothetical protein [Deinococcus betulae]MBZ9752733.1 hypothetical protein [Deinococcus betulae]